MRNAASVRRRSVTFAALAMLVVVPAAALVVPGSAAGWREMERWAAQQTVAFAARDFARPVLWGEPEAGDAGGCYAEAERIARANAGDHAQLVMLWTASNGHAGRELLAAAQAEALRARWAPAVAAMRAGARRATARPRTDVTRTDGAGGANLLDARWITNMAVLEARDEIAAGNGSEGVRATLDAATYGADFLASPAIVDQMIGAAIVAIAVHEGLRDEHLRQLGDGALAELEAGLGRLEERLPQFLPLDGDLLMQTHWYLQHEHELDELIPLLSAWRWGFSRRAAVVDAWECLRDLAAAVRNDAPNGLRERRHWWAEQTAALPDNPALASVPVLGVQVGASACLQVIAHTRLLRAAIALHRGGSVSGLSDPFTEAVVEVRDEGGGAWAVRCPGSPHARSSVRIVRPR